QSVDLKRRGRYRHRNLQRRSRSQNQTEVLVHEPRGELTAVIVCRGLLELSHVCRSDDRGMRQDIEQPIAIESGLLTECDGLGDGLHPYTQQGIHDQFHRGAGTAWAEIEILLRDRSE